MALSETQQIELREADLGERLIIRHVALSGSTWQRSSSTVSIPSALIGDLMVALYKAKLYGEERADKEAAEAEHGK